jgi:lipid-binding SYLF domain-containing protein
LQQYAHTLFFMNQASLGEFRQANGWQVGADAEYVFKNSGDNVGVDTTELRSPVVAAIFGRAGLSVGATLEGTKYSRIIR